MKYTEIILLVILACGFLYILPCRMNIEGIKVNKDEGSLVKEDRRLLKKEGRRLLKKDVKKDVKKGRKLLQKDENLVKEGELQLKKDLKGMVPPSTEDKLLGTGSNLNRLVRVPSMVQLKSDPVVLNGGVCFDDPLKPPRKDDKKCSEINNKGDCLETFCELYGPMGQCNGYPESACVWQDLKYAYFGDLNTECGSTKVSYLSNLTPNKDNGEVTLEYAHQLDPDTTEYDYSNPRKECIMPGELYSVWRSAAGYPYKVSDYDSNLAAYYFGKNTMFFPKET